MIASQFHHHPRNRLPVICHLPSAICYLSLVGIWLSAIDYRLFSNPQ
jgi:hypothetical protein